MLREVDIHEAKTHLSQLLAEVELGKEIVIGRAGKPVARLVPYRRDPGRRSPGAWRGQVHISNDVDELPDEVAAAFRGERP